jgi:hypothetical protein
MVKKRSQAEIDYAMELYRDLGSAYKVASKMGVSPKAVYRMLHEGGADIPSWTDPKPRRLKFDGEAAERVIADYQAGMSWPEMKEKYGCADYAMRECVRRAGIKLRDHGGQRRRISDEEELEIVAALKSGLKQVAVASKFGCNQSVVSRIAIKHGVSDGKKASGDKHGSWKGGISKNGEGYLIERVYSDDPYFAMATRSGYVPQHRLVMAKSLGRILHSYESVHHKDGDRTNNSLDNLQLRFGKHGKGVVLTCRKCGCHDIQATEL